MAGVKNGVPGTEAEGSGAFRDIVPNSALDRLLPRGVDETKSLGFVLTSWGSFLLFCTEVCSLGTF